MPAVWWIRLDESQRHIDAAVSKTVNLPADATHDDVREIFLRAWGSRVKGITVYRYGSRPDQVLSFLPDQVVPPVSVDIGYAGGCIGHSCEF